VAAISALPQLRSMRVVGHLCDAPHTQADDLCSRPLSICYLSALALHSTSF
jgi:hypothetical protein